MITRTDVANLAISALGQGAHIANLETDQTSVASTARIWFDLCRKTTLRDFNWNFATRFHTPGQMPTSPDASWPYAFRLPSDCLKVRKLLSGLRRDVNDSRIQFVVISDEVGSILLTDLDKPTIEYTNDITDPALMPSDFVTALSLNLAGYIAPEVVGQDPFKMGERALRLYQFEILRAKANSANESFEGPEPDSEFIRIRG